MIAKTDERLFHPLIHQWFKAKYGQPTSVQSLSWPKIARRENLVVAAPTGSGKTLTAFLSTINYFATKELHTDAIKVVYVSPLKSLNNDVQRNLLEPIHEIGELFRAKNQPFPSIRVLTRSGDTSQSARQKMLRDPPEILVTTPESLMLMLSAAGSRRLFGVVETVILDEIHALVENRRGAMLMALLERLVNLSGEFQRIALSATINPIDVVADYVAGIDAIGHKRDIEAIEVTSAKQIEFKVCFEGTTIQAGEQSTRFWTQLIADIRDVIETNRSTLIFVPSRRMAEKIAFELNEVFKQTIVYSHHGSLSREIREEVELKLKEGKLKAIVATSSLEMGIDIGELDEVLLVQSPTSISSTLQRIGRAGHKVGEISRARLYPSYARDLLDAAALSKAIISREIEPLRPLTCPLDLLAQLVVSLVASETWYIDEIFTTLTRSFPFAELTRENFDRVIHMLTGRYRDARIRSLRPRIAVDQQTGEVKARKGAAFALYSSGGTIPDRGYYRLRHSNSGTLIGELDEEFVWEAKVGQSISFGSQYWLIESIGHNDVNVRPASKATSSIPFYRSESINRDFHFSSLIGSFLKDAETLLESKDDESLVASLKESGFDRGAAEELVAVLKKQRDYTSVLPHTDNVVAEWIAAGPGAYVSESGDDQLVLHTNWGGRVNRPIALALQAAWKEKFRSSPDIICDNHSITIQLKQKAPVDVVLSFLDPALFRERMSSTLETSGFFGARFRECAGVSLLLTKSRFDQRIPLWMTRMQSKNLLSAAQEFADFPILLETWRTCLEDEFEMETALELLNRVADGTIHTITVKTKIPSPFAADSTFDQINRYMYANDEPDQQKSSGIGENLIDFAIRQPHIRPLIARDVIDDFEKKVQRRFEGYEPNEPAEQSEWVKERIWIPQSQWFDEIPLPARTSLKKTPSWVGLIHDDNVKLIDENIAVAVANALQFYGPHARAELKKLLPIDEFQLDSVLDELIAAETLIVDVQIEDSTDLRICDRENLEILFRFQRASKRVAVEPLAPQEWTRYMCAWQKIPTRKINVDNVAQEIELMREYDAPLRFWMNDLWQSRFDAVPTEEVEQCLNTQEIIWHGTGKERITFGYDAEISDSAESSDDDSIVLDAFVDPSGHYTFSKLKENCGSSLTGSEFNERFWNAVWRGHISSSSFTPIIVGSKRNFQWSQELMRPNFRSSRRNRFKPKGRANMLWPGTWYRLNRDQLDNDATDKLEDAKQRARILLDRYGILTREIANREGNNFRWSTIFDALRLMELSGEITSGYFVVGLSGPQFASLEAVQALKHVPDCQSLWLSAYDPASPCGLGFDWPHLPARRQGNYLGFVENELLISCTAYGRNLHIFADSRDTRLQSLFVTMANSVTPESVLAIEKINDSSARSSEYLQPMADVTVLYTDHAKVYVEPQESMHRQSNPAIG